MLVVSVSGTGVVTGPQQIVGGDSCVSDVPECKDTDYFPTVFIFFGKPQLR